MITISSVLEKRILSRQSRRILEGSGKNQGTRSDTERAMAYVIARSLISAWFESQQSPGN